MVLDTKELVSFVVERKPAVSISTKRIEACDVDLRGTLLILNMYRRDLYKACSYGLFDTRKLSVTSNPPFDLISINGLGHLQAMVNAPSVMIDKSGTSRFHIRSKAFPAKLMSAL